MADDRVYWQFPATPTKEALDMIAGVGGAELIMRDGVIVGVIVPSQGRAAWAALLPSVTYAEAEIGKGYSTSPTVAIRPPDDSALQDADLWKEARGESAAVPPPKRMVIPLHFPDGTDGIAQLVIEPNQFGNPRTIDIHIPDGMRILTLSRDMLREIAGYWEDEG